ncbi:MAG: rRNA maturation RNase YbeY [Actinobacteria bacterium]|jgi:probable rRNA maturation factor|uniref:rRNA maturation RNase YbeY n=1 Tax=Aquiluna sp. TaxID=2053504 RepID=UPI00013AD688|nr:rRNA maturation RNase YbeY [Aquiluna sp.]MDA0247154.1 rRNA maturation RNase YbeY [Actinomycetota bacterium]MDA2976448.1 rRNA maturation RNase YbeY [Actinomycetota bacterium]NCV35787.1 rRNA maturation RNase YbeY [Actinomycetota bacterium]NCV98714.1 rRNA maturation RNase YbeY [Actinomycetota bacterium]
MTIEITNESELEVDLTRVQSLAEHVREALRLHPLVDVGVIFVDEAPMTDLHVRWMDEPGPTDVLSFPMDELRPGSEEMLSAEGVLGDVVICPQVARRQAEVAGHEEINEILMLLTHGMLHLVGFDHAEPEEEKEMFALQKELLDSFYEVESNA